jgi:hypothetical protein
MTDRVQPFNGRRAQPEPEDRPFKHVIAEYRHAAQTVTCTCGWTGSSASADGRTSPWSLHVAANRPAKG